MSARHDDVPSATTNSDLTSSLVSPMSDARAEESVVEEPVVEEHPVAKELDVLRGDRSLTVFSSMDALISRPVKRRGRVAFGLALGWMILIIFCAVFAGVLPLKPYDIIVEHLGPRLAPRLSFIEPLGTDSIGRSTTARVIFGARQSLIVGVVSVSVALVAGLAIGMSAGYFKGKVDAVIGVILDSMLAIPALVTLLAIAAVGKRDITTVVVGLSIVFTPTFARLARANTLALVDREYVVAARAMGASHVRILARELLPSVILPLSSYVFLVMAAAIVAEGSLSYLGLGIPPPAPSWGGMINDGRQYLEGYPFLVFVPAACLLFTVLSFTIVGDRVRRHFDTRESALA